MAALIGVHGDQLMPLQLIDAIEQGKEFARVRGGLINPVLPLRRLVRKGAELRDDLKLQCPL